MVSLASETPFAGRPLRSDAPVRVWLWSVAALVVAMVLVGGATRLTDSGLSITQWKPILGAIPPLSDADWQEAFAKYREIPEYKRQNAGMSLSEFKVIYWWEWAHRFLGRFIGLAFALPFAIFLRQRRVQGRLAWRLGGIFGLGALQGVIGWWMVASGLVDRVDVAPYRLAIHLMLACLILAALVAMARSLALRSANPTEVLYGSSLTAGQIAPDRKGCPRASATAVLVLIFVQVFLGALVAGNDAGLTYNTWPLMDGRLVPEGLFLQEPAWRNLFENVTTVQFMHRLGAYLLLAAVLGHLFLTWRSARRRAGPAGDRAVRGAAILAALIAAQAVLGIVTLIAVTPMSLALIHQFGAAIVVIVAAMHRTDLALRRARHGRGTLEFSPT